jgi:hypothetical protein
VLGPPGLGSEYEAFRPSEGTWPDSGAPRATQFILSAARSHDERVARAFATELLAPTQGIRQMPVALGEDDDSTLETIADRCQVSPLLVRYQSNNQIAA